MILESKSIKHAVDCINSEGVEKFLKENGSFSYSNIDGVYHYDSKISLFDKFIFFDFGKVKELSLVIQENPLTLMDVNKFFHAKESNYDFRDDISKIILGDNAYIMVNGKVDISVFPIKSIDARGNIMYEDEIPVSVIVIEFS